MKDIHLELLFPVKDIKLLCVLASEEGLKHVQAEFPDLEVPRHVPATYIAEC